ncbi:MAG: hypothetical protein IKL77_00345, partial [Clostridia bacterium]|nr:hypothetical protein [Clostridia bacterium]
MIIKFIKKNLIACLSLFMAVAVLVTGSISFARYASGVNLDKGAGAGSFICTANIDDVSALSFTNTAFWGGTAGDDKIAMNALRSINFSVYNYDHKDASKKPSDVKLGYALCFSAPAAFIEKLALQLFDNESKALLPQIVILDLLHAVPQGQTNGAFNTKDSEDFNASACNDLIFNVEKADDGTYTAVSNGTIISLTPFEKQVQSTLNYRVWDVHTSGATLDNPLVVEGGKLQAPLTVKFTAPVRCYKVTISMPQFKMNAGSPQVTNYSLRLAPTSVLEDSHLGSSFYDGDGNLITELYSDPDKEWSAKTIHEEYEDTHWGADDAFGTADDTVVTHGQNLMSNKVYQKGHTEAVETTHTYIDTEDRVRVEETIKSTEYKKLTSDAPAYVVTSRQNFISTYQRYDGYQTSGYGSSTIYSVPVELKLQRKTVKEVKTYYETVTETTAVKVVDTVTTNTVENNGLRVTQTISETTTTNTSAQVTGTVETVTTTIVETIIIKGTHTFYRSTNTPVDPWANLGNEETNAANIINNTPATNIDITENSS